MSVKRIKFTNDLWGQESYIDIRIGPEERVLIEVGCEGDGCPEKTRGSISLAKHEAIWLRNFLTENYSWDLTNSEQFLISELREHDMSDENVRDIANGVSDLAKHIKEGLYENG